MTKTADPKWLMSLKTALGSDALTPVALHADEAISEPFVISVDAVSKQRLVDPDQLLFKPATLTLRPNVCNKRLFNGMVRAVTASGTPQRGWWHYTLSIVPKLWFMGQTADCRVFQQMATADILQTLCGEAGQSVSLSVGGGAKLDYVTQYNETDLQFATRLMQQAGYFYFFQHSDGDHTMIIADQNSAFPTSPSPTLAVVHEGSGVDTLTSWRQTRHTAWGQARLIDYDPQNPSTAPDGSTPTKFKAAGAAARDVTVWPAWQRDYNTVRPRSSLGGLTPAEMSLPLCSPASRPLRAGFAGGLRPAVTQAAPGCVEEVGRGGETALDRTEKHRQAGPDDNPGLYF